MDITYSAVEPGGNRTLLVESPVDEELRPAVGRFCIRKLSVEQVAFADKPKSGEVDAHVHMMGDEFCANGVRARATRLFQNDAGTNPVRVSCSGTEAVIECQVSDVSKDQRIFFTDASMEASPLIENINDNLVLVHLDGISHFVCLIPEGKILEDIQEADYQAITERHQRMVSEKPAVGVIFYHKIDRGLEIKPWVHVRKTMTTVQETGCASGTIALALVRYSGRLKRATQIRQPSGEQYCTSVERLSGKSFGVKVGSTATVVLDGLTTSIDESSEEWLEAVKTTLSR